MTGLWLPRDGGQGGEVRQRGITKASRLFRVMAMFPILIMVRVSWVYEGVRIYQNCTLLNMCSYCMSASINSKRQKWTRKIHVHVYNLSWLQVATLLNLGSEHKGLPTCNPLLTHKWIWVVFCLVVCFLIRTELLIKF